MAANFAFTDYNDQKFLSTLSVCLNFIDDHIDELYSPDKYKRLQKEVYSVNPISDPSIRKSINHMVKFGFIYNKLKGYHPLSKDYLKVNSDKERQTILSKIIYHNSSFSRSVKNDSKIQEINILIQTLIHNEIIKRRNNCFNAC